MPQSILRPSAAGDITTWTPSGAATVWQALGDDDPVTFAMGTGPGSGFRVALDDLPAEASTVTGSVTLLLLLSGDDVARFALILRLAGVDETDATPAVPPDGGFALFSRAFALAPGGLPWTVARVNALQAGINQLDISTSNQYADRLSVAVDWEPATPVSLEPAVTVLLDSAPVTVPLGGTVAAVGLDGSVPVVSLGPTTVDIPLDGDVEPRVGLRGI